MKIKNIIIADDQNLFAEGIKQLLEQKGDIKVDAIIENGADVLKAVDNYKPDALLLDLNMPGKNGFEILEDIRKTLPELIIGILSTYDNQSLVEKAQKLKANAYLSKDATIEELRQLIFCNYDSCFFLSSELQLRAEKKNSIFDNFSDTMMITNREKQIIKFIAKGLSSEKIASELFISPFTVKTHRKNLFKKLKVNSVTELLKIAYENNII